MTSAAEVVPEPDAGRRGGTHVELREKLTATGLDAGPDTIGWHLEHHHGIKAARATISRHLTARGLVVPEPKKRP